MFYTHRRASLNLSLRCCIFSSCNFRSCWLVTWRWSLPTDAAYKSNSDPTWEKCYMFSVIEDRRWFSVSLTNNTFCNLLATAMVADRISSFPSQLCARPLWKHWGDQLHGTKLSPARGNAYKVTKGKCEIMWAPPGKCPKHLRRKSLSFGQTILGSPIVLFSKGK